MTDKKIIALPGCALPPQEADEDIVTELERLLSQAKAGEITGIAFATIKRNPARWATGWTGQAPREDIHSAVQVLAGRVLKSFLDDPEVTG